MRKLQAAHLTGLMFVALVAAADMSGQWTIAANFDDGRLAGGEFDCTFKQNGEQLTGDCSERPVTGLVKGQDSRWQLQVGNPPQTTTCTGTVVFARLSASGCGRCRAAEVD
jgi:hypothetical protein